jgi:hypothetical protein
MVAIESTRSPCAAISSPRSLAWWAHRGAWHGELHRRGGRSDAAVESDENSRIGALSSAASSASKPSSAGPSQPNPPACPPRERRRRFLCQDLEEDPPPSSPGQGAVARPGPGPVQILV